MNTRRNTLLSMGLLLVATFVVFSPALGFGPIRTWDDTIFVIYRPEILDWWGTPLFERLTTPGVGYPIPLPTALYAALRAFFGEDGYYGVLHGIHLVTHLTNVGLVAWLARRWSNSSSIAIAVAGLWALHPLHAEIIGWMTNTKTVLGVFFILAALVVQDAFLRNKLRFAPATALTLVAFLGAIASRPDAAILPFVLGGVALALHRFEPRKWLGFLSVLGAVAVPYVIWAGSTHADIAERAATSSASVADTVYRVGRAFEMNIWHMLAPFNLQPSYFRSSDEGLVDALPGWAMILLGLGAIVWAWRNDRRLALAGAAIFVTAYVPFSNIVFIPRMVGDTYLYLPLFGFIVALVGALPERVNPRQIAVFATLATLGLALLASVQIRRWQDPITLWAPVVEETPEADKPYRHIAFAYIADKELEKASVVIETGLPYFKRERAIPYYAITVLRDTRGPQVAASVGVDALLTNRKQDPEVSKAVVETLVSANLALPADETVRNAVRRAANDYEANPTWMANPQVAYAFGVYFLNNGEPELARTYFDHEAQKIDGNCDVWRLMPDLGPAPSRCNP